MYEVNGLPTVLALHRQLKSIQLRVPIDYYIRSLDSAYYCMKNLVTGPLTQTTMPTTIQTMEFYLEASSTGPVEDGVTYIATSLRSNNRIHRDSVFLTSSTAWGAFSPKKSPRRRSPATAKARRQLANCRVQQSKCSRASGPCCHLTIGRRHQGQYFEWG